MALTNISNEHIDKLLVDLNKDELNKKKITSALLRNSNNYGKLKTLIRQMNFIKNEINNIIDDSLLTTELEKVSCKFIKRPGKNYYLYQNIEKENLFFSMLEPEMWEYEKTNYFIGEYLYDYDLTFQKVS